MAVGNNSQTVGKNLVNNKGRYADIATVQALTGLEPGDFVVIEDITGYDTNPLFNLSPELADGDFDPNAADYLAVWDGSTWEIIDQDTGGGGQGLMECVELTLVSDGSKVQIFNAYFDTDSQEWVGSDGTVEVRYVAADVSNFNDCCCGVKTENHVYDKMFSVSESVQGTFDTILTNTSNYPDGTTTTIKETGLSSTLTIPTSELNGLIVSGTPYQVSARVNAGYRYEMATPHNRTPQWGFDLFIDGVRIARTIDNYILNTDGFDYFIGGEILGEFISTGSDIEVEVLQYVIYGASTQVIGDVFGVDLAQIVVDFRELKQ